MNYALMQAVLSDYWCESTVENGVSSAAKETLTIRKGWYVEWYG